jgi:hypothetical protein
MMRLSSGKGTPNSQMLTRSSRKPKEAVIMQEIAGREQRIKGLGAGGSHSLARSFRSKIQKRLKGAFKWGRSSQLRPRSCQIKKWYHRGWDKTTAKCSTIQSEF